MWKESIDHRLVVDCGSWNIRMAKGSSEEIYSSISKVAYNSKTNKSSIIKNTDKFIDEINNKFLNCHTKGVLTNYLSLNKIFEDAFNLYDISLEKRAFKNHSIISLTNIFEPERSFCNYLDYIFDLVGFGAILPVKFGQYIFTKKTNFSGILIDIGHSKTSIIPVYNNSIIKNAHKRLDIGGKLLTKCLIDNLSTSQYNIRNYFFTGNSIKEKCCEIFVEKDNTNFRNLFSKEVNMKYFVLPDYDIKKEGYLLDKIENFELEKDFFKIGMERYVIPEILFSPHIIEMEQKGISELFFESLSIINPELIPLLTKDIIITGQTAKFPGFVERLKKDIYSGLDNMLNINIRWEKDTNFYVKNLQKVNYFDDFESMVITKKTFDEYGSLAIVKDLMF